MTDNMEDTVAENEYGFAAVYSVELLLKEPPVLQRDKLYAKIQEYTGPLNQGNEKDGNAQTSEENLAVWEPNEEHPDALLHFFHLNYTVEYEGGSLPAQTAIVPLDRGYDPSAYTTAIQQAWHWPDAREAVERSSYSLILHDLVASALPHQQRLELFTGVLKALLETLPCEAVYWRSSDKLVEPQAYLAALEEGQLLYGALNIRMYQAPPPIEGRSDLVMDSCGLAALGIPDVQCHFHSLEPNEMAGFLLNIAHYLYNQGDVISDGETVGYDEEQRWACEHQYSLVQPRRIVLDINPGPNHYAGA